MRLRFVLGIVFLVARLSGVPAAAQCCHHHGHHCGDCADCNDCDHHCYSTSQSSRSDNWAPSTKATVSETTEGKIAEVNCPPGATEDSGMVEIHVQTAGQAGVVRLGPLSFLKQSGLVLREGDTVKVKAYPVASMEGAVRHPGSGLSRYGYRGGPRLNQDQSPRQRGELRDLRPRCLREARGPLADDRLAIITAPDIAFQVGA